MKTRSNGSGIPIILAVGLVSAWSAAADDMGSGAGGDAGSFYARGEAGVAIMQDMTFMGTQVQFNVGPRVDVSAGYNITENIAVELQAGFAHNEFSKANGISFPSGFSADLWSVPVMASGIYTYKFNDHWQAYGGAGAGVLITTLGESVPGSSLSATDCEFGYQGMAGIKYLFNDNMECGLGYNFTGSLDHHFTAEGNGTTTSPTYLHSILLSFTYKF